MTEDGERTVPLVVGLVFFCLVVGGLFWSLAGAAPPSPPADVAAARVVAFYRMVERMDVAYAMHVWRGAERRTTTTHGRVAYEPRTHRVELASDERGFAVEAGELTVGEPGSAPTESTVLAAMFDVLGADLGTFDRRLVEPVASDPTLSDALELTPRGPAPFERVVLHVSNASGAEGVVVRITAALAGDAFVRFDLFDFHFTEPPE